MANHENAMRLHTQQIRAGQHIMLPTIKPLLTEQKLQHVWKSNAANECTHAGQLFLTPDNCSQENITKIRAQLCH